MQEAIHVRLDEHSRRLAELERTQPAVLANQVQDVKADIAEIRDEVKALRRSAWGLAGSITVGAVVFAFTAFQIWGGPG